MTRKAVTPKLLTLTKIQNSVGILLKRPDDIEKIETDIIELKYFNNFVELVNYYPMERLYFENYTKDQFLNDLNKFYTKEEQIKYGVVAIILKKQLTK